jgi:hypothetical protein
VLPFANASGTPKDEELAATLTNDFTIDLAQIRGSVVVARSMAQAIAARNWHCPPVGSELAVRYVLEGAIMRSPERAANEASLCRRPHGRGLRRRGRAQGTPGSLRSKYMGATPDKFSRTGAAVVARMRSEGQIVGEGPLLRGNPNGLKLVGDDGTLINIDSKVDMASGLTR